MPLGFGELWFEDAAARDHAMESPEMAAARERRTAAGLARAGQGTGMPDDMTPERIAPLVVWLCTDAAAEVNGQDFSVGSDFIRLNTLPTPA